VLFDLNGTLLDPEPVAAELPVADGTEIVLSALHDAVVQGMVDTLSGVYRPFLSYIRGALSRQVRLAGAELDAEALEVLVRVMAAMPPQPDAADAVAALRDAGCCVGVLTNSASGPARDALEMAGLASAVGVRHRLRRRTRLQARDCCLSGGCRAARHASGGGDDGVCALVGRRVTGGSPTRP
jgi:phosphoglycolate phosphatase-like HAD superfamily hydrolase